MIADGIDELIEQARGGSVTAFEKLYRMHVGRVHGLCVRVCGSQADAEDATQETFIKAWRALNRFRGESAFSTWLHRIYEYTHEETAEFMGISVGASKAQVHRATKLLRLRFPGELVSSGSPVTADLGREVGSDGRSAP